MKQNKNFIKYDENGFVYLHIEAPEKPKDMYECNGVEVNEKIDLEKSIIDDEKMVFTKLVLVEALPFEIQRKTYPQLYEMVLGDNSFTAVQFEEITGETFIEVI
jgi:hypothetical protein